MEFRSYRIIRKVEETPNVVSVYLSPEDGLELQPFRAGQHLRFRIPEVGERTYALSAFSLKPRTYRITVRRGPVTGAIPMSGASYWHAKVATGDSVEAFGPTGSFHVREKLDRPLVFLSAGIGEALLTATAEELAVRAPRHQSLFLHNTVNSSTFALKGKLASLRSDLPNTKWFVWYSRPRSMDRKGKDYDLPGGMEVSDVERLLPIGECDFYICGPDRFVSATLAKLRLLGVSSEQIQAEGLGTEEDEAIGFEDEAADPPLEPRRVRFARSDASTVWTPEDGSLLELAERHGIAAAFSCRTGMCGKCAQKIFSGQVYRIRKTHAEPLHDHQLLCSNVPLSDLEIDL